MSQTATKIERCAITRDTFRTDSVFKKGSETTSEIKQKHVKKTKKREKNLKRKKKKKRNVKKVNVIFCPYIFQAKCFKNIVL